MPILSHKKMKKFAIRRIVYVNYEIPTHSECEMHLEVQRKLDLGRLKITQLESNYEFCEIT